MEMGEEVEEVEMKEEGRKRRIGVLTRLVSKEDNCCRTQGREGVSNQM